MDPQREAELDAEIAEHIKCEQRYHLIRGRLDVIAERLRSAERQKRAAELELGEVLRGMRAHNEPLPERDSYRVPITYAEQITGLSRPTLYKLEAEVPDDGEDGIYDPDKVPLYSNEKLATLYREVGTDDDTSIAKEFLARFPAFVAWDNMIAALYRHWQDNNPNWFTEIGNEPELAKQAMRYRNRALRAVIDGPLADPDPEGW